MRKIAIPFLLVSLLFACQTETVLPPAQQNNVVVNDSKSPSPVSSLPASTTPSSKPVSATPSPAINPPALLSGEKDDEDKDVQSKIDKEPVSTDSQAVKTNVNWKLYNPIVKGKKYTYSFTLKEGTLELKNDVLWEIAEVSSTGYIIKKTIISDKSSFASTNVPIAFSSDNSPSIVPLDSVGGDKIEQTKNIVVSDKTEKVKVPLNEYDAFKIVSTTKTAKGDVKTTNWYAQNIGLIKSMQESPSGTYILELKDYK